MRVRMLTKAAGPSGIWPEGSVQDVSDGMGKALIGSGFAEAVDVEPPSDPDPVARETADAPPRAEQATAPQTKRKPTRRKSTAKK